VSVWEIDTEFPQGHLRPMTPEEEAQHNADRASGAAAASVAATQLTNEQTIISQLAGRMAQIRTARTGLANGTIFAALSANEKAVIDGLLQDDLYLGRMVLQMFDSTG
jgi:hypothetical protein